MQVLGVSFLPIFFYFLQQIETLKVIRIKIIGFDKLLMTSILNVG